MFDFVDPTGAGRRTFGTGWEAGLDEAGQGNTQHHAGRVAGRHQPCRISSRSTALPHHAHSIDRWDDVEASGTSRIMLRWAPSPATELPRAPAAERRGQDVYS